MYLKSYQERNSDGKVRRIGRIRVRKEKLLDILTEVRTGDALDCVLSSDRVYQSALDQQKAVFEKVDRTDLNNRQSKAVDQAISAVNHCGAVYGVAAYRLGLRDGIRLASEVKEFEN